MRRTLARFVKRAGGTRWARRLGRIPGVSTAYDAVKGGLEPPAPDGPIALDYDGYDVYADPRDNVGAQLYAYGEYEPGVTAIVEDCVSAGDAVVDVGAHYGTHTVRMHRAVEGGDGDDGGRVVAVEPHPEVRALLERTVAANGLDAVDVVGVAVGERTGTTTLRSPGGGYPDRSRLAAVDGRAVPESGPDGGRTHEVETVTLADLFRDRDLDRVALMKVDVEGHELSVLRGLGDRIDGVEALLLEVHGDAHSAADREELADLLAGFSAFAVVDPEGHTDPVVVDSPADVGSVPGRILFCR
jgi:FkbM family methyltransferase